MNVTKKVFFTILLVALGLTAYGDTGGQTIQIHQMDSVPKIDGSGMEWNGISEIKIPLTPTKEGGISGVKTVFLKGGVHGEYVYFFVRWKDSTEDTIHKPFVWDDKENRYLRGEQREDRFSIQFEMEGDYDSDWFSGNEFQADMWHWKSSRTNPQGKMHDKMTVIKRSKLKRSYKGKAKDGGDLYIHRPSDRGSKMYKNKRYSKKEKETMPKYILVENPEGSVADVSAKGVWSDGEWHLEIKRKLNTGHADDVVFKKGQMVRGGIAIFNRSDADDHNYSGLLTFQF